MDEELFTNLSLYITPTEVGKMSVDYNGDALEFYPTEELMEALKKLHNVFETPEAFLESQLAKELQELSDDEGINVTVYLYGPDDADIAWFEFWPNSEVEWDTY